MMGLPIVRSLHKNGFEVAVATRNPSKANGVFPSDVPVVGFDYQTIESAIEVVKGFDAVHINLPSGPTFESCFSVGLRAMKAIAAAIKNSKVKRVSFLSGATVSDSEEFPPVRAKYLMEQELINSNVPYTLWRSTWFMESLGLTYRWGVFVLIGNGRTPIHWLAGDDFGDMVSRSFNTDEAKNVVFYPYGSECVSLKNAIIRYRGITRPFAPIVPVPIDLLIKITGAIRYWEGWYAGQLMKHLEVDPEPGDPTETKRIVGEAKITINQFAKSHRKKLSPSDFSR